MGIVNRNINDAPAIIGTSSSRVLLANPRRYLCILQNDSDTTIYINLGKAAALNRGTRLNANGGSYEINLTNPFFGEIFAISNAATKTLLITEASQYAS